MITWIFWCLQLPFFRSCHLSAINPCHLNADLRGDSGQMDIERNEKINEENGENEEIKEDLSAPTIASAAKRTPDRRLVCLGLNLSYILV